MNSSIAFPMNMLAMTPQTKSGFWVNRIGPGVRPCMMNAPNRMAIVGELGMPNVSSGIMAPPQYELFAVSGPATPSMAPWPNFSGFFEIFFSNE